MNVNVSYDNSFVGGRSCVNGKYLKINNIPLIVPTDLSEQLNNS